MQTSLTMFQVIHPPYKKVTLACIACLCFEIGVCPWPDLSALFQYTSTTPVVSLHLILRIQYHPGIPVTLLTGPSFISEMHMIIFVHKSDTNLSSRHCLPKIIEFNQSANELLLFPRFLFLYLIVDSRRDLCPNLIIFGPLQR